MDAIRQIYEKIPATITIPPELRERRVEVIILTLDQGEEKKQTDTNQAIDKNGWPIGFFEETFGSAPDLLMREPQGEYEIREELE